MTVRHRTTKKKVKRKRTKKDDELVKELLKLATLRTGRDPYQSASVAKFFGRGTY